MEFLHNINNLTKITISELGGFTIKVTICKVKCHIMFRYLESIYFYYS